MRIIYYVLSLGIISLSCSNGTSVNKSTKEKKWNLEDTVMVTNSNKKAVCKYDTNELGQFLIEAKTIHSFTNNYALIVKNNRGYYLKRDGGVLMEYPMYISQTGIISNFEIDDYYVDKHGFVNINRTGLNIPVDSSYRYVNIYGYVHFAKGILHNLNDSKTISRFITTKEIDHKYFIEETDGPYIDTLNYKFSSNNYKVYNRKFKKLFKLNAFDFDYLKEDMFAYYVKSGYYSEAVGLISNMGQKLTTAKYYQIGAFSNGYASFKIYDEFNNEKWGVINKHGVEIIPPQYSNEPTGFHNNRAFIKAKSGLYSLIDTKGNHITEDIYWEVNPFQDGKSLVKSKLTSSYQIVDTSGIILHSLSEEYRSFTPASDYLILVQIGNSIPNSWKYGYIDYDGNVIIPTVYNYLGEFHSGLAVARFKKDDGTFITGYINKKGEFEIIVKAESKY